MFITEFVWKPIWNRFTFVLLYELVTIHKFVGIWNMCMLLRAWDGVWSLTLSLTYLVLCVCLQICMPGIAWACANDCMLTEDFIHTWVSGNSCLCKSELWVSPFRVSFECFQSPVCLWKPCVRECHREYLCCVHVMGGLCPTLLWPHNVLCVWMCGKDTSFLPIPSKLFKSLLSFHSPPAFCCPHTRGLQLHLDS